jgi:bifunctional N-acetylglucosamine-1-phosphate-uridyltransferase/glucosamine-1-phosphate-acetyltransferase GlmU-like protein
MIYKSIQNFIKSNLVLNFKNELKNLSNNINLIFKNSDEKIKKILLKKKIKTRNKKIKFIDAICYIFNNSFIDSTKQSVVSNYNFENNINGAGASFAYILFKILILLKF